MAAPSSSSMSSRPALSSLRHSLALLSAEQRRQLLETLSPTTTAILARDWELVLARPEQVAPEGDWHTWLITSGRGWGKSRTGAEWVRSRVQSGFRRIALIGQTAADVRDVMINGPAGLLTISPSWFRPRYEPSKRLLTWPNG